MIKKRITKKDKKELEKMEILLKFYGKPLLSILKEHKDFLKNFLKKI